MRWNICPGKAHGNNLDGWDMPSNICQAGITLLYQADILHANAIPFPFVQDSNCYTEGSVLKGHQ